MSVFSKCVIHIVNADGYTYFFSHWVVPGLVPAYSATPVSVPLSQARKVSRLLRCLNPIVIVRCSCG